MIKSSTPTQTDMRAVLECVQDMLEHATTHKLCVSMLSSALRHRTRVVLHYEATGKTFADQLRLLLEAGGSARFYLWGDLQKGLIANDILDVLSRHGTVSTLPRPGELAIRASGSVQMADRVPHFLIVHPIEADPAPDLFQIRVEPPPANLELSASSTLDSEHVKGIFVEGMMAAELSVVYLNFFNRLFEGPKGASPANISIDSLRLDESRNR